MAELHFAPEVIGNLHIGPLPITNTLLVSWLVMAVLVFIAHFSTRKASLVPSGWQNAIEYVLEGFYNMTGDLAGFAKAKVIYPLVMTFFIFIIVSNWIGLLPGVGTIGYYHAKEFIPFLRAPTSDLNTTLGLAIVSVFATHILALYYLGVFQYLQKWFSLNPVFLFVGILELIGELTKTISLSFRLFGNIFAGEVVIGTVSGIFAFLAPLPFYGLEVIVGLVQALVFMMLTLVFIVVITEKSHH